MPVLPETIQVEVYQLFVWIREISPTIWRRLLVRSDCTLYDLHYILQLAFGWADSHLHQFKIYGKPYGIYQEGGISFQDNPREVHLADFRWRINERFLYQYDLGVNWEHEIRFEKKLTLQPKTLYPICISGSRKSPPESCHGPWHYQELCQHFSFYHLESRLTELLYEVSDNLEKNDITKGRSIVEANLDEARKLQWWIKQRQDKFDRKGLNLRLKQYGAGNREWLRGLS